MFAVYNATVYFTPAVKVRKKTTATLYRDRIRYRRIENTKKYISAENLNRL
jgi:hypothetical protein